MRFIPQLIPEVILIEPEVYEDDRGYFFESFRQDLFEEAIGYKINFIQENESNSEKGVLRGLHFQVPPYAQAKLVRVIKGSVLDVAVDIRVSSPTFGKHVAVNLTGTNKKQLFIPKGFAHGFIVLSDKAIFSYKVDNFYTPDFERVIAFNDKSLAIDWILDSNIIVTSTKDKAGLSLSSINF